jgi:hypothetical protein
VFELGRIFRCAARPRCARCAALRAREQGAARCARCASSQGRERGAARCERRARREEDEGTGRGRLCWRVWEHPGARGWGLGWGRGYVGAGPCFQVPGWPAARAATGLRRLRTVAAQRATPPPPPNTPDGVRPTL